MLDSEVALDRPGSNVNKKEPVTSGFELSMLDSEVSDLNMENHTEDVGQALQEPVPVQEEGFHQVRASIEGRSGRILTRFG